MRWKVGVGSKLQFSSSRYSLMDGKYVLLEVVLMNLHCNHVCRTSFMCFLVFRTPRSNHIAKVAAFVLDLCVVAHHA
jgi:hypothetical protein